MNGKRYGIALIIALLAAKTHFFPLALYTARWQYGGLPSTLYTNILNPYAWLLLLAGYLLTRKNPHSGWRVVIYRIWKRTFSFQWHPARYGYIPGKWRLWVKMYGTYFWQGLIPPIPMLWYPEYDQYTLSKKDDEEAFSVNLSFFRGLGAILVTGVYLCIPQTRPGALWFVSFILMWCHIGPQITQSYADRYLYFALPGLLMIVCQAPVFVWICALGWYAAMTWVGSEQFRDFIKGLEYNEALGRIPRRALYSHAYILYKSGELGGALFKCRYGLSLRPHDYNFRVLMSNIFIQTGDFDLAERYIIEAKKHMTPYDNKKQAALCDTTLEKIRELRRKYGRSISF
jgi:hypothetical protein